MRVKTFPRLTAGCMQMADNMHPGHAVPNESRVLLKTGIKVLMLLVPGWKAPKLAHPHAKAYDDEFQLLEDIKPGDQVMVRTSAGYYHRGIYVGKQQMADSVRHAVVGDHRSVPTGCICARRHGLC